ncbi:MAG: hypothetical protein RRY40_05010, partial [Oscillospiraceae bacterium]
AVEAALLPSGALEASVDVLGAAEDLLPPQPANTVSERQNAKDSAITFLNIKYLLFFYFDNDETNYHQME